ncbi:MAG TPA: PilC/PilY family type IV pilus protein [Myxococcaceae bacterium]|nr:PilC/PilY family type IV pilus protein [Myxococcaceae bacterium]
MSLAAPTRAMRHVKLFSQFAVMWVLVFVMAAGPLPLGIPVAHAGPVITDTPGIKSFYEPKIFIIFDTSKSMQYRPGDPNGDPSAIGQDWDPSRPGDPCDNKWCIGKKSLYLNLPKFTSRIYMGMAGYTQYYQLTKQPENLTTSCTYDRIALGNGPFATWTFKSLTDLTGTGTDPAFFGATSPVLASATLPNALGSHSYRKEGVSNPTADPHSVNVVGAGFGPTDTFDVSGEPYPWWKRLPIDGAFSFLKTTPTCQLQYLAYNGGACATQPCDLFFTSESQVNYPGIWSNDVGPSFTQGSVTYDRPGAPWVGSFNAGCGLSDPYSGATFGCNGVQGGCELTKNSGPTKTYIANTTLYEFGVSPGPTWDPRPNTTTDVSVQLTTYGASCPAIGTVVDQNSGPAAWQWMSTAGTGAGQPNDTGCRNVLGQRCSWTAIDDKIIPGETYQHYCTFRRTNYNWSQYTFQCNYTARMWQYTTSQSDTYCNYRYFQDFFAHPEYLYSVQPNPGDIVGATLVSYTDRDDQHGLPTPVTYSGGQFSNGDCPNVIANSATHPECSNGVICKLSWRSGAVPGYPRGRYSLLPAAVTGYPWLNVNAPGLYPAADPPANLSDPLFPVDPTVFSGDWLTGGGFPDRYYVDLVADYYDPLTANPPVSAPLAHDPTNCPTCTYQFSETPPPTVDAAGFAAVAAALPPNRTSGWGRFPDGRSALTFTPFALDNALPGQPILNMLSKYDPVTNPQGLQTPAYGDYTPLTGALTNVADWLKSEIDTDPYAACRRYYVLLMTDGEEFPDNLPSNDPVGAVKRLRNLTTNAGLKVDVQTFVIGFGLLAPSPQLNQMAQAAGTSVSATDPGKFDPNGVAFDGSSPTRLLASLDATFGAILDGYFTRSKPVINVAGTEMYVGYFRLLFNGTEWQGKLDSIDIDNIDLPTYTASVDDTNYSYLWRYGTAINLPSQPDRKLYTSLDPNAGNRIDFAQAAGGYPNSNTPAQQTMLEALLSGTPGIADATIAFLANKGVIGDQPPVYGSPQSFTNGVPKTSRASDIYHAVPAIVEGATNGPNWPDATEIVAYGDFRNAVAARKKTVYIGANDGMLHAVEDAVTAKVPAPEAGQERWGYVPKQILSNLPAMRDGHEFGVDGSVAIADVCGPEFGGGACTVQAGWKTLLVGAFGKGAGGLYALDITDPSNPLPKWEINSILDENLSRPNTIRLGYTLGAPVIARTKPAGTPKWSVFMPGGMPPMADSLGVAWGNVLYVLDASTGALLDDGANQARILIPDDPADPRPNGLIARPTVYRPGDRSLVERAFFTDLEGKIWKLDVTSPNIIDWKNQITAGTDPFFDPAASNLVCTRDLSGLPLKILDANTGLPVTTGTTTLPLPKPRPTIFNRPYLALDNATGLLNVYVGTGDSEHPNTATPGGYDYFYGVSDVLSGCGRPLFAVRFAQNEKMLSDPAFDQNVVYVTTYLPPAGAAGTCSDLGHGFLYSFDARTGVPVKAIVDYLGVKQSKIDLGVVPGGTGIPSSPMVRNGKLYVALETDPSHPRQFKVGDNPPTQIKVEGWQRVK